MMEIKRYTPIVNCKEYESDPAAKLTSRPDGEAVLFSDHAAAVERLIDLVHYAKTLGGSPSK